MKLSTLCFVKVDVVYIFFDADLALTILILVQHQPQVVKKVFLREGVIAQVWTSIHGS